jgi:hypothetical protein
MKCPHCGLEVRIYMSPYICLGAEDEEGWELSTKKAREAFEKKFTKAERARASRERKKKEAGKISGEREQNEY